MNSILRFSTRHPVSVLMGVLTVIVLGILAFANLPVDFLPSMEPRSLLVATEYPGMPASEIREMVTIPVENALATLKGLKGISSVSRDGASLALIELQWGVDADMAMLECKEIMDEAYGSLPANCGKPTVLKDARSSGDTLTISVRPLGGDLALARRIADGDVKSAFQRIEGVGSVCVTGGDREEIEVLVDRAGMEGRKLTIGGISDILSQSNYECPAGSVRDGDRELLVKTSGLYSDLSEIPSTVLSSTVSSSVRLSDVATVRRSLMERDSFFMNDGIKCVRIGIRKRSGASPIRVADRAREELAKIGLMYGRDCEFAVVEDMSESVRSSLLGVLASAAIGMLVTMAIIRFALGSWSLAGILSSAIPISACASAMALFVSGKSLNLMSLSGMAIGIGMVVDCGSVALENLRSAARRGAVTRVDDIAPCVAEVSLSNVASTVTTVIVFVPVLLVKGAIGELFSDLAISIVSSICASCLLAVTLIPSAYAILLARGSRIVVCDGTIPEGLPDRLFARLSSAYGTALKPVLSRRIVPIAVLLACVAVAVVSFALLKKEFLPRQEIDRIAVDVDFPDGVTIDCMERSVTEICARIGLISGVTGVSASGGMEPDDYRALADPGSRKERVRLSVATRERGVRRRKIAGSLLESLDPNRYKVRLADGDDPLCLAIGITRGLTVVLGDSPSQTLELARSIAPGDGAIVPFSEAEGYAFRPDRVANSRYGIGALRAAGTARDSIEGAESAPLYERGVKIPVRVRLNPDDVSGREDLGRIGVRNGAGTIVPISSLGKFERERAERVLYRFERKDARIVALGKTESAGKGQSVVNLTERQTGEMLSDSAFLLIVVAFLLYVAMAAQFESFRMPLVLLASLPPAFSGAFLFLALTGKALDVNGIIALVALFGTSVNNSIILYERCAEKAAALPEAVSSACSEKLRAILITMGTNIGALLPFAIDPWGLNRQSSLSIAIIGGLVVSCALVLFVVPCAFVRRVDEAV